jgi:hypothetical protein
MGGRKKAKLGGRKKAKPSVSIDEEVNFPYIL